MIHVKFTLLVNDIIHVDYIFHVSYIVHVNLQALEKVPHLHSLKQAFRFGLDRRNLDDVKAQFIAELCVKMILLGHGSSHVLQQYALQQPVWATGGSRLLSLMFLLHLRDRLQC